MDERYLNWGRKLTSKSDLSSLPPEAITARCLWAEARGASLDEKQKVGCVIRNRVRWHIPKPIGAASWAAVILKPLQFSWTMDSDPNLPKVLDPLKAESPDVWEVCCRVAEMIVSGTSGDTTYGADHYHDESMDGNPPSWAKNFVATVQTERFRFFRSLRVKQWT